MTWQSFQTKFGWLAIGLLVLGIIWTTFFCEDNSEKERQQSYYDYRIERLR